MGDSPTTSKDYLARTLTLTDAQIVALTLYGEARSESLDGIVAVGAVIRNRAIDTRHRYGRDVREVCFKKWQFSCWWDGTANQGMVLTALNRLLAADVPSHRWPEIHWMAEGIVNGVLVDNTRGATHYMTRDLLEHHPPKWVASMEQRAIIGAHVFFKELF